MEIEIAEWDFNLDRCNKPVPYVLILPTMEFLELATRNNNELWITILGSSSNEYNGRSFKGVVDISMTNTPCKANLSASPTYYALTLVDAPYVGQVTGGVVSINKVLPVPGPTVLDAAPIEQTDGVSIEEPINEFFAPTVTKDGMDSVSIVIIVLIFAIGFSVVMTTDNS